jgi:hypothetical protein
MNAILDFLKSIIDGFIAFIKFLAEIPERAQFLISFLPAPLAAFFAAVVAFAIVLKILNR